MRGLDPKMYPAWAWMTKKYFAPTEIGLEIKRLSTR